MLVSHHCVLIAENTSSIFMELQTNVCNVYRLPHFNSIKSGYSIRGIMLMAMA